MDKKIKRSLWIMAAASVINLILGVCILFQSSPACWAGVVYILVSLVCWLKIWMFRKDALLLGRLKRDNRRGLLERRISIEIELFGVEKRKPPQKIIIGPDTAREIICTYPTEDFQDAVLHCGGRENFLLAINRSTFKGLPLKFDANEPRFRVE